MGTIYTTGGTVRPDSPGYIERKADAELFEALKGGEYCYVLDARQKGKSSLMARCQLRLETEDIRTVVLDLQRFGSNLDAERWYAGLLDGLGGGLGVTDDLFAYWGSNLKFGPMQRFFGAIEQVLLTEGATTIFIDEIDFVRSLPFSTDEFFAGIRECYNRRSANPLFENLTFCLLGVATPSELVRDVRLTPFNIGTRIDLTDFTLEEAQPLASGLGKNGTRLLARIHHWTNGHPFLTQAVCAEVAQSGKPIDEVVRGKYLGDKARETDSNLADVGNRLLGKGDPSVDDAAKSNVLSALVAMLTKGIVDDESNPSTSRIKMSGVARIEQGRLTVRNRIYAKAFDKNWVRENMPGQELLRQRRAYWLGALRVGATAAFAIGIISWLAVSNMLLARESQRRRLQAEDDSYVASMNYISMVYQQNNLMQMREILDKTRGCRLRGWEWEYWNRVAHLAAAESDTLRGSLRPSLSPDGKIVASGTADGVQFFDSATLRKLWEDSPARHSRPSVVFWMNDGRRIVDVDNNNNSVQIRDARTGSIEATYTGFIRMGRQSASPDCTEIGIVTKDFNGTEIVDLRNNTFRKLPNPGDCVFSPDGAKIADVEFLGQSSATVIAIRDRTTLHPLEHFPVSEYNGSLLFSNDSRSLFYGDASGVLSCFEMTTKRPLWKFALGREAVIPESISAKGDRLCAYDLGGKGYVIQLGSHKPEVVREFPQLVSPEISGDGSKVVGANQRNLAAYDVAQSGVDASFRPDPRLTVRDEDRGTPEPFLAYQRGMQTGEISFPDGGNVRREDGTPLIGYEWGAFGMDCNGALEAAQRNGHLEIVDWRTGKSLYSEPHGRINWALIATLQNPDRVAISTDNDGRFEVVSIATRRPLWTRTMGAVVLSLIPCGDLLVVYCSDGSVSAWDEASGHLRWSLANKSVEFGLNCSADGGKLAEDDGESNVLIRDARSGRTLLTLRGHSGRINDVGFSPDGTRIVSCSRDGTVRVWDGIGGQQLTVLPDPGPHPFFCRFVEQGRRIATIDGQGFVRLYGTGA